MPPSIRQRMPPSIRQRMPPSIRQSRGYILLSRKISIAKKNAVITITCMALWVR
jgi:hypothetical protein